MRYNKRIIYFKSVYKTDLCDCLTKETQKERTYTVDGLINGGGGYIRVGLYPEIKYSLANGWGLKSEILRYIKSHLSVELGSKKLYKFESCLLI